jgi:hypothetical protein
MIAVSGDLMRGLLLKEYLSIHSGLKPPGMNGLRNSLSARGKGIKQIATETAAFSKDTAATDLSQISSGSSESLRVSDC